MSYRNRNRNRHHDREQAKHANEAKCTWGIDGTTGVMTDMKDLGIWEPFTVKTQTYKTAVEVRSERRLSFAVEAHVRQTGC